MLKCFLKLMRVLFGPNEWQIILFSKETLCTTFFLHLHICHEEYQLSTYLQAMKFSICHLVLLYHNGITNSSEYPQFYKIFHASIFLSLLWAEVKVHCKNNIGYSKPTCIFPCTEYCKMGIWLLSHVHWYWMFIHLS